MFEQMSIFGCGTVVPVEEKQTYTEYFSTESVEQEKPKSRKKQKGLLMEYLKTGAGITGLGALRMFGIMRLPARIAELKEDGHNIAGRMVEVKNRHGEVVRVKKYWLKG